MLTLIQSSTFRRAANTAKGPEYHGSCPVCGGKDRFHIWPEQGQTGTWWCRHCEKGGDLIEFYRWRDGLGYREACERAGQEPRRPVSPLQRRQSRPTWTPAAPAAVTDQWAEHAAKLAHAAAERLQETAGVLDWLSRRGIDAATAAAFGLGWLPRDEYRTRESWGLPTETKPDGKAKKLWIPAGILIPCYDAAGRVIRLRVRRDNPDLRYYVVPGSSRDPYQTAYTAECWLIVESELDALAVFAATQGLNLPLGIVAMGNSTARPTAALHALLESSLHISVALDNDPPKTPDGHDGPGGKAAQWWCAQYRQARRTPPLSGKDPGEMVQHGISLSDWVLAGLPPRYQEGSQSADCEAGKKDVGALREAPLHEAPPLKGETAQSAAKTVLPTCEPPAGIPYLLPSGRPILLARDPTECEALLSSGIAVFQQDELVCLRPLLAGMDTPERDSAVDLLADLKEIFSGARIAGVTTEQTGAQA